MKAHVLAATVSLALAGSAAAQHAGGPPHLQPVPAALAAKVKLELVTTDTTEAVGVVAVPDERPGRLFVVEKRGLIRILRGNKLDPAPFLDFTARVSVEPRDNGERGLLGLAFHPQFTKNGRFYVNFTDKNGDTRVLELKADKKRPDRADPASERQLLFVKQPYSNHNGGNLVFGPDGKLYVGLGDGGKANDPHGNGQNPEALLAKMLRIDVDAAAAKPEIIDKGLRNPWRYSFDRQTGDLYIADVGQNLFEYVHVLGAKDLTGHNFGWNIAEGYHCFAPSAPSAPRASCDVKGLTPPVMEYTHKEGCSISGGFVYRGKAIPELQGNYFYADYCTAIVRSFKWKDGKATDSWEWKAALDPESQLARVAGFGEDQDGELYLVTHEGPIFKFVRR
jgi:glucose/arabinose dehydrogenase